MSTADPLTEAGKNSSISRLTQPINIGLALLYRYGPVHSNDSRILCVGGVYGQKNTQFTVRL